MPPFLASSYLFSALNDARPQSSRRQLLRGLAISPVAMAAGAGAGTMIAKAAEASPDAELIALCDRWKVARKASDDAWDDLSRLEDLVFTTVRAPDALEVREGDGRWPQWYACTASDGRQWYPPTHLDHMRVLLSPEMPSSRNPRLKEIVAAHDSWAAAKEEAAKAIGVPEAHAKCDTIDAECQELARRLALLPARTLPGVLAKVEVAVGLNCGFDELEFDLQDLLRPGKVISNDTLAMVVLRDLARLGGAA